MGWELRHGRRYLYRSRRVNGKPVKEYLAPDDWFGLGRELAAELDERLSSEAEARRKAREQRAEYRARIDALLAEVAAANGDLRTACDGLLELIGYQKHNRGDWRMKYELKEIRKAVEALTARAAGPKPLVKYEAPASDAEAVELFAKVRAGDAAARDRLAVLIREREWTDWLGDLGRQATGQLVWKASGGDAAWETGITEKTNALRAELLGAKPSVVEVLLVRRVVNGWLATHTLELELTVRPPLDARDRAHLDAALTRAQKRYTEAIRELARVRRLQAPQILAQLNVAAAQTVVNTATAPPATAPRVLETVRTEPDAT